ncbi:MULTISPECIES: hypothetical protein [Clostridia]|nr:MULTISPECIES: hypothetical protein [Clostridia]
MELKKPKRLCDLCKNQIRRPEQKKGDKAGMVMNKTIKNAMEELEDWLSDPSELGKKPAKIEYTNAFADEDGINCLVFKYKKNLLGKWLLGIVSESGTFSEMGEYNQKTEIDDAKRILEMLKNYWKEMAKN